MFLHYFTFRHIRFTSNLFCSQFLVNLLWILWSVHVIAASGGSPSQRRIGELLARLPELKRANIEHRLIVAQVQQLIPEIEMSSLYQEIFLSGRGAGGVQH